MMVEVFISKNFVIVWCPVLWGCLGRNGVNVVRLMGI